MAVKEKMRRDDGKGLGHLVELKFVLEFVQDPG